MRGTLFVYIHIYLFILLCLVTSCLRRGSSQGIYIAIYWLYWADPTVEYTSIFEKMDVSESEESIQLFDYSDVSSKSDVSWSSDLIVNYSYLPNHVERN